MTDNQIKYQVEHVVFDKDDEQRITDVGIFEDYESALSVIHSHEDYDQNSTPISVSDAHGAVDLDDSTFVIYPPEYWQANP